MQELLVMFGLLIGDVGHGLLVITGVIYLTRIYHAAARGVASEPDWASEVMPDALPSTGRHALPPTAHELDIPDLKALGWRK